VRSEQSKYEAFSRQRNTVMTKYRRINQSFNDLVAGLMRAQNFYSEMKETVASLQKNVESFVNNRRSEGGQLLAKIEQSKSQGADQEQQRLKELMERMSMDPSGSPVSAGSGGRKKSIPPPLSSTPGYPSTSSSGGIPAYNPAASPPVTPRYPMPPPQQSQPYMSPQQSYAASPFNNAPPRRESYNPNPYPQHAHSSSQSYNPAQHYHPTSPPAHQQFFSPPPPQQQHQQQWGQHQQQGGWTGAQQGLPQGYVPPPPPPGPPPAQQGQEYGGYGGYGGRMQGNQQQQQQQPQQQQQNDPWAGLSGWK
jgi:hypothetical protein